MAKSYNTGYTSSKEDNVSREDEKTKARLSASYEKIFQTVCLVATWTVVGQCVEIYGPTLIDLKLKLNTDYESVSWAISGRSAGGITGSIIAGVLVDRFPGYCHLIIAIVLDCLAAATFAVPFATNNTVLWLICFVVGNLQLMTVIAGNRLLFNVWREKSSSPLLLVHLGYGIGSFIVPLYVNPFLAETREEPDDSGTENSTIAYDTNGYNTTAMYVTTEPDEYREENVSRVEYSYAIAAAYAVLISSVFYLNMFRKVRDRKLAQKEKDDPTERSSNNLKELLIDHEQRKFKDIINPATCAKGRFWYGTQIIFFTTIYFANIGGGANMTNVFLRTFSVEQLKMSNDVSTLLNTSYWISFSIGRFVMAVLARWLSVRALIVVQSAGIAATAALITFTSTDNVLSYWILIVIFAFFLAATWPMGIAWTDYHIELTGLGMTIQGLGSSVSSIGHMRLIGYLYDHYGPTMFLYQTLGYCVIQFVISVVLNLIGGQHGSRFGEEVIEVKEPPLDKEEVPQTIEIHHIKADYEK